MIDEIKNVGATAERIKEAIDKGVCEDCGGSGFITVDVFDGEHDQYTSRCECNLPVESDED